MLKNIYGFVICLFAGFQFAYAQPSIFKLNANTSAARQTGGAGARVTIISPTHAGVKLQHQLLPSNAKHWLAAQLGMRQGVDEFADEGAVTKTAAALAVTKLHQYYKGIKVEHGVVNTTSQSDSVVFMQMEFYSIPDKFTIVPALTSAAALKIAAASMRVPDSLLMQYGRVPGLPSPAGELVIVRTYDDDSTVCLAWKFEIHNHIPYTIANVYVNAQTGKVVLRDALLKDADVPGTAATRYSGTQTIITDNQGGGKPYTLRQRRNGHDIITLNMLGGRDITKAVDFVDNDNNWQASEHRNAKQDDVALDVHFNMQIISDYLKVVLNRNSWDNAFAPFTSYVHVGIPDKNPPYDIVAMNNAGWGKSFMIYGDGTYSATSTGPKDYRPLTSLDVSAHEIGHAVTQTTSNLVYGRESGALNEGFSDIWGALIEKWGIDQNPSIAPGKSVWMLGEEIGPVLGEGLRNMKDPRSKGNPSTYKDDMWIPADASCDPFLTDDHCGVHSNSGVVNKWTYLITVGEASDNSLNQPYNVKGIGFEKMAALAYLTVNNLTPNAGFRTCKAVSMEAATVLWGAGSPELETVRSAWNAVGVDSAIWVMDNTPVFAANSNQSFTAVGIARNGDVWAGTNRKGLYVFDGTNWTKRNEIPNVFINQISPDGLDGMWVAQSGTGTGTAAQGGVNYFAPDGQMTKFYTVSTNIDVPTRNVRGIYIDSSRLLSGMNPSVWVATNTYINSSGNSASGKPALGINSSSPAFSPINAGIEISNRTNGVTAIHGGDNKVWTFSALNYGKNQILSYDATTGALLAAYDHSTNPEIPENFIVKAIYYNIWTETTWFGLNTNAVLVVTNRNAWHYVSFPSIFPPGSQVNNNAITGSRIGDIYIGTTAGLVFFEQYSRPGRFSDSLLYRRYGKPNGLPSNNITGLAYDRNKWKIWVATDAGMCLWDPLCIEACGGGQAFAIPQTSVKSGNWSDPTVWENNKIPDSNSVVKIDNDIIVDINAECQYITVNNDGSLTVNTGKQLKVYGNKEEIILDGQRRLKK